MLGVTILGNNSAVPTFERHPTSQVITLYDDLLMFDCGEGTQIQMIRYKIRRSKISHIFISHLHGDHYFGLIGLLNSFALLGRIQPLHVIGPAPLWDIIHLQLKHADTILPYELHFHALEKPGLVVEEKKFTVRCFPTKHRIECWGFRVDQKKNPRKIDPEKVKSYGIPGYFYERLQMGEHYTTQDGKVIRNEWVTQPNTPSRSYAFCADTRYSEELLEYVSGVGLLYHETTYLDNLRERAIERYHSTSKQAAEFAQKANAGKLIIGHFSSKYDDPEIFLTEACPVFPNTEIAREGTTYLA